MIGTTVLFGCSHSDDYVKHIYNELHHDISQEYKEYADFTSTQEAYLDEIARDMVEWHRANKLPTMRDVLQAAVSQLQYTGRLNDETLHEIIFMIDNPISFDQADQVNQRFATLALTITDEQVKQIGEAITEEEKEFLQSRQHQNSKKTARELARQTSMMFKGFGISLSKEKKADLHRTFSQLQDTSLDEYQALVDWNQQFLVILEERSVLAESLFVEKFRAHWENLEKIFMQANKEAWTANQMIFAEALNSIIIDLNEKELATLIAAINKHIGILNDLITS
jgi:hypothetical protein